MRPLTRIAPWIGVVAVVAACGGPAAPPAPPPKAATPPPAPAAQTPPPAKAPGTPAVMDPKGTIDAAKGAAGAASAANQGRQAAAGAAGANAPGTPGASAVPGAIASAGQALNTGNTPKYDAQGRRDPFDSLEIKAGSDRASVTAAKLTGVIHGGPTPLALVETSDGIGYILKPGDTLADGQLLEIGTNMVVFSIPAKPGQTANRVVLKLASE